MYSNKPCLHERNPQILNTAGQKMEEDEPFSYTIMTVLEKECSRLSISLPVRHEHLFNSLLVIVFRMVRKAITGRTTWVEVEPSEREVQQVRRPGATLPDPYPVCNLESM